MDCHSLLQGIFPTQESNLGLLHCRGFFTAELQGKPSRPRDNIKAEKRSCPRGVYILDRGDQQKTHMNPTKCDWNILWGQVVLGQARCHWWGCSLLKLKWNLHNIKLITLKCTFSMAFSIYTVLCNHHLCQVPKHFCDPEEASLQTCSPPGSSIHGILQARILEWVVMPSSRGASWSSTIEHMPLLSPASAGGCFPTSATWEAPKPCTH